MGATPREQFNSLSKRFPNPSNAVAIAALGAIFEFDSSDSGVAAGLRADVARSFLQPLGIIPRMRLLAAGWTKPGDSFRKSTDSQWWRKRYAHRLWEPLGTWVDLLEKANLGQRFEFDEAIAKAEPSALSAEIAGAAVDLQVIQQAHADICAPFIIPGRRGALPEPNVVCLARIEAGDRLVDIQPIIDKLRPSLPWWVWVAGGLIAIKLLDRR